MKRVSVKITRKATGGWQFVVIVDGETFAAGVAPNYIAALGMAQGYAVSLAHEADEL